MARSWMLVVVLLACMACGNGSQGVDTVEQVASQVAIQVAQFALVSDVRFERASRDTSVYSFALDDSLHRGSFMVCAARCAQSPAIAIVATANYIRLTAVQNQQGTITLQVPETRALDAMREAIHLWLTPQISTMAT